MRFLVDADLPVSTVALIRRHGHEAAHVRDIGMGQSDDADIARHAKFNRLSLLTGDFGFADVRNYPPPDYPGIIVFEIPNHATAPFILQLIESFLTQLSIIGDISGKLIIVAPGRIRIRTAMP